MLTEIWTFVISCEEKKRRLNMIVRVTHLNYVEGPLGLKAVLCCYADRKEVFRDEVKLWQAKSRDNFVKRCLRELPEIAESVLIEEVSKAERLIKAKIMAAEIAREAAQQAKQ